MSKRRRETKRTVDKVVDGDTFKVRQRVNGSQYVRIAGVNAPEKGEPGYHAAKRALEDKIEGRQVTIRPVSQSYGRTVAEVPFVRRKKR